MEKIRTTAVTASLLKARSFISWRTVTLEGLDNHPHKPSLIGSADNFLPACQRFCAKGRELGAQMEIEVYEGQPHSFFNKSPWREKTTERADRFLEEIGFLAK